MESGKGEPRNRIFLTLTSFSNGPCFDSGTKIMIRDSAVPIPHNSGTGLRHEARLGRPE